MTVTIYDGATYDYVILKSKHPEFIKKYGRQYEVSTRFIYMMLAEVTSWANNDLKEECLFEVD